MPEDIRLVDRIATDLAEVRWPEPVDVRRRGDRRRRRRTAGMALVAMVALTAMVAVWPALAPGGAADLPTAAASLPGGSWIPPEALLQPEDVGPDLVALREVTGEHESLSRLKRADPALTCPAYAELSAYTGTVAYLRGNTLQYVPATPGDPLSGEAVLHQTVIRMPGGLAGAVMGDVRRGIDRCASYTTRGQLAVAPEPVEAVVEHRWVTTDSGFAGDESLVFAHRYVASEPADRAVVLQAAVTYTTAMVRVGDLISVLQWERPGTDPTEARRLTSRAARWLCVAANPGC